MRGQGQSERLCSNPQRGCGIQQLAREAELFRWIADYFKERMMALDHEGVTTLLAMVNLDMASYPGAKRAATLMSDGAP